MAFADDNPGYEIVNEEQARNVVLDLVNDVESARIACNIVVPDNHHATAELQRKAYARFMVKHGGVLGTLTTLHRCRRLNDVAYNELRQRVIQTLAPTIVGGF
jgi:hypothetical protein